MNYANGTQVQMGDQVKIAGQYAGTVVADIDSGRFSPAYPAEQWGYLRTGILVNTVFGGLLHYPPGHRDTVTLIQRRSAAKSAPRRHDS